MRWNRLFSRAWSPVESPRRWASVGDPYTSHQFPTGCVLSLARRFEVLEWAKESNAFVFEDDYDSEFRYAGPEALELVLGFGRLESSVIREGIERLCQILEDLSGLAEAGSLGASGASGASG